MVYKYTNYELFVYLYKFVISRDFMKTNKFATKRLRLTRQGKVLFRPSRQNHFNAKESGASIRQKRGFQTMGKAQTKVFKKILSQ